MRNYHTFSCTIYIYLPLYQVASLYVFCIYVAINSRTVKVTFDILCLKQSAVQCDLSEKYPNNLISKLRAQLHLELGIFT